MNSLLESICPRWTSDRGKIVRFAMIAQIAALIVYGAAVMPKDIQDYIWVPAVLILALLALGFAIARKDMQERSIGDKTDELRRTIGRMGVLIAVLYGPLAVVEYNWGYAIHKWDGFEYFPDHQTTLHICLGLTGLGAAMFLGNLGLLRRTFWGDGLHYPTLFATLLLCFPGFLIGAMLGIRLFLAWCAFLFLLRITPGLATETNRIYGGRRHRDDDSDET